MPTDGGMSLRSESHADERSATRTTAFAGGGLLLVAVVLAALNLRPSVTSAGAALDDMRQALGASATWAGALTTMPGLCFAVAGLAAPWLARRIGLNTAVAVALGVLAAGLLARVLNGPWVILGGTLVASAGIALANVLIPVVVKASFAARIGLITGVYTAALQLGGASGSALTPPLGDAFGGWRAGLGSWAVLAAVALVVWLVATRGRADATATARETPDEGRSLLRSPLAWIVTLFFGSQACFAYIMMGWLPQVLLDAGVSRTGAGLMMGMVSLLGLPTSLLVAPLATRRGGQSWWIVGIGTFGIAGVTGLMLAPSAAPLLWSILIGIGMSVFTLAIATIALRARTSADTARLSGMAQGLGYLFGAAGPFLFGLLRDLTGDWTAPCAMLLCVLVGQLVFGYLAGKPRYV
ncbi:CynX/NimT family MFS transporter [Prauserella cavernicola]|uniref:MFS transporter n=1 Tax=Prauserella cavernicola TaxID=2800127 RepID=A0A934QUB0_9PSEU|nr:MFS transporter [Prauserella cavernicola]MBK1786726.1 MFS transporter [Prauserella cavernicola]